MCGSRLEGPAPVPVLQPAHHPNKNPTKKEPPKKKPANKRLLILVAIILVIVATLVWVVPFFLNKQKPKDTVVSVLEPFRVVCGDGYEYEVIVNSVSVRGISFTEDYMYHSRFGADIPMKRPTDETECVIMNITIKNVSDYRADTQFAFETKTPSGADITTSFLGLWTEPYYDKDKDALLDFSAILDPGEIIRGDIMLGWYEGTGVYKVTLKHSTYNIESDVTIELRVSK